LPVPPSLPVALLLPAPPPSFFACTFANASNYSGGNFTFHFWHWLIVVMIITDNIHFV